MHHLESRGKDAHQDCPRPSSVSCIKPSLMLCSDRQQERKLVATITCCGAPCIPSSYQSVIMGHCTAWPQLWSVTVCSGKDLHISKLSTRLYFQPNTGGRMLIPANGREQEFCHLRLPSFLASPRPDDRG